MTQLAKSHSWSTACWCLQILVALLMAGCGDGGPNDPSDKGAPAAVQVAALYAVASVAAEPAGANCLEGGARIAAGIDTNRNGVLDLAEVSTAQYVCNGATGLTGASGVAGLAGATGSAGPVGPAGTGSLVRLDPEPAGVHCVNAGWQVSVGSDTNNNGRLDSSEVSSVAYVCNGLTGAAGATGSNGSNGVNGLSSLLDLLAEPAGANCLYGGTRVQTGLDGNRNGLLDVGEVTSTSYVCHGPPGPGVSWVDVTSATVTAMPNVGYLARSSTEVAITLPSALAVGDVVRVSAIGPGGWRLLQNAGQSISTTGLPGNVEPGNDWAPSENQRGWFSVALSSDGQRLAAAAINDYIYTSSDSGMSWTARDAQRAWISVASSNDGIQLIASTRNDFLYVSHDAGLSWQQVASAQNWGRVASSADGSKLAAVAQGGFIYISSDYGQTWTATASVQPWRGIAMSADGSRLYAVGYLIPFYTSADSGATWTNSGPSYDLNEIAISADGRQVAIAPWTDRIFVSSDFGVTWAGHETSRQWIGIAASADGSQIVASEYQGAIHVSSDHGRSWRTEGPTRDWLDTRVSADGSVFAAAAYNTRMFVSTGVSHTTVGTAGALSGPQGAAIELQYAGSGRFNVLSHNDPTGGFKVD